MMKQFKLMNNNGLYLTYRSHIPADSTNYLTEMFQDNDFFPKTVNDSLMYSFKNSKYIDSGIIVGSNALSGANSSLTHTEITNPNQLTLNEIYYNKFKFNFSFTGSELFGYTPDPGITGSDFSAYLNRLRVKLYVKYGNNIVSLNLSNLEFWNLGTSTWNSAGTNHYDNTLLQGFKINTGLNGESCIDLGYGLGAIDINAPYYNTFADYFNDTSGPTGFNFRLDAEVPNFDSKTSGNRDYTLIVKYLNIGVTGSTTLTLPYKTSESVELMANTYPWFQIINPYIVPSGGGFETF